MMNQILNHCDGVTGTADDAIFHGKDDEEHDRCHNKLMEVAHVLNGEKCVANHL